MARRRSRRRRHSRLSVPRRGKSALSLIRHALATLAALIILRLLLLMLPVLRLELLVQRCRQRRVANRLDEEGDDRSANSKRHDQTGSAGVSLQRRQQQLQHEVQRREAIDGQRDDGGDFFPPAGDSAQGHIGNAGPNAHDGPADEKPLRRHMRRAANSSSCLTSGRSGEAAIICGSIAAPNPMHAPHSSINPPAMNISSAARRAGAFNALFPGPTPGRRVGWRRIRRRILTHNPNRRGRPLRRQDHLARINAL